MHELSIIDNIIKIVEENARKAGFTHVDCIKLRIGEMRQIVPDSMEFAFDSLKKDTLLENAKLEYTIVPVEVECRSCGLRSLIKEIDFTCKKCGGTDLKLLTGKELQIESIEGD